MRTYVIKNPFAQYWDAYGSKWVAESESAVHYVKREDAEAVSTSLDTSDILEIVHFNNRKAGLGRGHVPRGSVVEICVGHVHAAPIVRTVMDIRCNGCNSFIISCGPHPTIKGISESYNISHITRVLKHGSGSSKLSSDIHILRGVAFNKGSPPTRKGRNQYGSYSMREIIMLLADTIAKDEQWVDQQKLVRMIYARHVLHPAKEGAWDKHYQGQKINKKKLKRIVRQLLPKCLLKHAEVERSYQEELKCDYERDLDRDMEQDREINPARTEGLNVHGNTQLFIDELPVCGSCHGHYVNTGTDHPIGNGTSCATCKEEVESYTADD